jgi:hypothetical protein
MYDCVPCRTNVITVTRSRWWGGRSPREGGFKNGDHIVKTNSRKIWHSGRTASEVLLSTRVATIGLRSRSAVGLSASSSLPRRHVCSLSQAGQTRNDNVIPVAPLPSSVIFTLIVVPPPTCRIHRDRWYRRLLCQMAHQPVCGRGAAKKRDDHDIDEDSGPRRQGCFEDVVSETIDLPLSLSFPARFISAPFLTALPYLPHLPFPSNPPAAPLSPFQAKHLTKCCPTSFFSYSWATVTCINLKYVSSPELGPRRRSGGLSFSQLASERVIQT